jgi:hypothetical protein
VIDPDRLPWRPRTRRWVELYVALNDADVDDDADEEETDD